MYFPCRRMDSCSQMTIQIVFVLLRFNEISVMTAVDNVRRLCKHFRTNNQEMILCVTVAVTWKDTEKRVLKCMCRYRFEFID